MVDARGHGSMPHQSGYFTPQRSPNWVMHEALVNHDLVFFTVVKAGPPPLEAILVIFGRRALIFFLFESSWKKMKNDTTFVRMRSGDHLGDAKMSKKGTSLRRI